MSTSQPDYVAAPPIKPEAKDNPLRDKGRARTVRRVSGSNSRPASPTPRPKAPAKVDYATGLKGLLPLAILPLVGLGRLKPVFFADAAAVSAKGPKVCDELSNLAQDDPRIAAIVEKATKVGPYGALLAAAMELSVQIATNHKPELIAVTGGLGAVPPMQLINSFTEEMAAEADKIRQEAETLANSNGASSGSNVSS
jgi:hypothetical protein